MGRFVVLTASPNAQGEGYSVRLGPLAFVTPADTVAETVGDGLEAVGAALVASDRSPRSLKLKLPVRGYHRELDATAAGRRLRRQVRAAFDNARLRLLGFYFVWEADPDLDGWLMVGAAELSENDAGISFGEFEMDMSDVYIVGRPGTHRPGRRAQLADRRTGLVPRDTRRLLYSADFAAQPLPDEPLVLPGDIVDLVASGNRPVDSTTLGPLRGARRLWRTVSADTDAEILTYLPDEAILPGRSRYLDIDDLGAVRVWDLSSATSYPPDPEDYTAERDTDPNLFWGWERVLGDVLTADRPLAIDNGACRLIWLGSGANQGLAVEYWDDALGHYSRVGRVLHALNVREQRVIEATPERAVIEWRAGQYGMRAILQRGWWGPRLESYDDGGDTARLEFAPLDGDPTITPQTPTWVRSIEPAGIAVATNRVTNPKAGALTTTGWTQAGLTSLTAVELDGVTHPDPSSELDGLGISTAFRCLSDSVDDRAVYVFAAITGETYVCSAWIWLDSLTASNIRLRVTSATTIKATGAAAFTTIGQWVRLDLTVTADTTENYEFRIYQSGAGAAEWYHTGVLIEEAVALGPYFDGDQIDSRWTGAANNSTSERLARLPVDMLWASGSADEVVDETATVIAGPAASFRRDRVLVAQLSPPPGPSAPELAGLSLIDARPVPVLVGRR